jgi:hypothetical protein
MRMNTAEGAQEFAKVERDVVVLEIALHVEIILANMSRVDDEQATKLDSSD